MSSQGLSPVPPASQALRDQEAVKAAALIRMKFDEKRRQVERGAPQPSAEPTHDRRRE